MAAVAAKAASCRGVVGSVLDDEQEVRGELKVSSRRGWLVAVAAMVARGREERRVRAWACDCASMLSQCPAQSQESPVWIVYATAGCVGVVTDTAGDECEAG